MRPGRRRNAARVLALPAALAFGIACARSEPPTRTAAETPVPDWPDRYAEYDAALGDVPEYREIQERLATG